MEQLLEFMDAYWGVTVVGGITVGGIITFALVQLQVLRRDKKKNILLDGAIEASMLVIEQNHAKDLENAKLLAENEYLHKTINLTFKSISYLTAASKLTIEDKLALQEDFTNHKNESVILLQTLAKDTAEDFMEGGVAEAIKENLPEALDIAVDVAEKAVNLVDKYTKGV